MSVVTPTELQSIASYGDVKAYAKNSGMLKNETFQVEAEGNGPKIGQLWKEEAAGGSLALSYDLDNEDHYFHDEKLDKGAQAIITNAIKLTDNTLKFRNSAGQQYATGDLTITEVIEGVESGETTYDGTDDGHVSSAAALKISGAQTWCCEVWVDPGITGAWRTPLTNCDTNVSGFEVVFNPSTNRFAFYKFFNFNNESSWHTTVVSRGQWIKLVAVQQADNNNTIYVDGVSGPLGGTTAPQVATLDFQIAKERVGAGANYDWHGKVRNVEIYSGEATNPASWVPGDIGSLTGTTLRMRSRNGSGLDNQQGLLFNASGDPVVISSDEPVVSSIEIDGTEALNAPVSATLDVTATPAVPAYTAYDGDDGYFTTDSKVRGDLTGNQTWCCEVFIPALIPDSTSGMIICNIKGSGDQGCLLWMQSSSGVTYYDFVVAGAGWKKVRFTISDEYNQWVKLVGIADIGGNSTIYVNGVQGTSLSTPTFTPATNDNFGIGYAPYAPDDYDLGGNVRNIEIYTGLPADPTLWVPSDTSSMTSQGCTLVMDSADGSGTDNNQSISFTIRDNPVIVPLVPEVPGVDGKAVTASDIKDSINLEGAFSATVIDDYLVRIEDTNGGSRSEGNGELITLDTTGIIFTSDIVMNGGTDSDLLVYGPATKSRGEIAFALNDTIMPVSGETAYDGNDHYTCTDAELKVPGSFTWCFEIRNDVVFAETRNIIHNQSGATGALVGMWVSGSDVQFLFDIGPGTQSIRVPFSITEFSTAGWVKVVCVCRSGSNMQMYVDDVAPAPTSLGAHGTPTASFYLSNHPGAGGRQLKDSLRNIEIYSGYPTDPTLWVPGDITSMTGQGATLVMQSRDGSGTDNEQGLTFTPTGDPEVTGHVDGNLVDSISIDGGDNLLSGSIAPIIIAGIDDAAKLVLHMDDTGLTDDSNSPHSMSVTSAVRSATQSKFDGYSAYFNGNSQIQTTHATDWSVGAGAFTIDFWVYNADWSTAPSYGSILTTTQESGTRNGMIIGIPNQDGTVNFWGIKNGATTISITTSVTLTDAVWNHVAIVGDGSTVKIYLNGVERASGVPSDSIGDSTTISLGRRYHDYAQYSFDGYIDEFRFSKGVVRWTEDFSSSLPFEAYSTTTSASLAPVVANLNGNQATYIASAVGENENILRLLAASVGDNNGTLDCTTTNILNQVLSDVQYGSALDPLGIEVGTLITDGTTDYHVNSIDNSNVDYSVIETYETISADFAVDSIRNTMFGQSAPGYDSGEITIVSGFEGTDEFTKLIMHMDDTGLTDATGNHTSITKVGSADRSATISKFGGYSLYCPGSGSYLSLTDHPDWDFGAENFTIDFWMYPTSNIATNIGLIRHGDHTTWDCFYSITSGTLYFYSGTSTGQKSLSAPFAFTINTMYHIAIVRDGDIIRFFVNGTPLTPSSDVYTGTANASAAALEIGRTSYGPYAGYIDEVRISKGIARWTSDFSGELPASAYTTTQGYIDEVTVNSVAITDGTDITYESGSLDPYFDDVLLLVQSLDQPNGGTSFSDVKGHTISDAGSTTHTTSQYKFDTSSIFLNGASNGIEFASDSDFIIGTQDFCIEFFTKVTSWPAWSYFQQSDSSDHGINIGWTGGSSPLSIYLQAGTPPALWNHDFAGSAIPIDSNFHHVALCRDGNIMRLFIDGVQKDGDQACNSVYITTAYALFVGTNRNATGTQVHYMEEYRFTVGVPRYTTDFSIPAEAFPNTALSAPDDMAERLKSAINAHTSSPNYSATRTDNVVTITADDLGGNTYNLDVTKSDIVENHDAVLLGGASDGYMELTGAAGETGHPQDSYNAVIAKGLTSVVDTAGTSNLVKLAFRNMADSADAFTLNSEDIFVAICTKHSEEEMPEEFMILLPSSRGQGDGEWIIGASKLAATHGGTDGVWYYYLNNSAWTVADANTGARAIAQYVSQGTQMQNPSDYFTNGNPNIITPAEWNRGTNGPLKAKTSFAIILRSSADGNPRVNNILMTFSTRLSNALLSPDNIEQTAYDGSNAFDFRNLSGEDITENVVAYIKG